MQLTQNNVKNIIAKLYDPTFGSGPNMVEISNAMALSRKGENKLCSILDALAINGKIYKNDFGQYYVVNKNI